MDCITVEKAVKKFGKVQVLNGVDLGVKSGELVTLLGPSGCGKSTLLRLIAGLETPTAGKIYINQKDVTNLPVNKRNLGMVFQQYSLFPNMSVYHNVAFGLNIKKTEKKVTDKEVKEMLSLVQLEDKIDSYPNELSGGQQQRVALARALVVKPNVLLLDEPLSALDAKIKISLRKLIKDIQRELGITTIFVTHDQEEAFSISDRIFVLEGGQVVQYGTPHEIYSKPANKFVAGFLGAFNCFDLSSFKNGSETGEVFIRPENIEVVSASEQGKDGVHQGKVKDFSFFGNVIRLVIDVDGTSVLVDVLNSRNNDFISGQDVWIHIPKEKFVRI